ncbi:hypothetical protein [Salinicoccus roseus]|uniref:hypothetical protein n=1 Tax=Salinicoccus roseus TaxID=45670 RepID=UPI002301A789|nr:hypothetical protein [Salinicoccus roseus]
MSIQSIPIDKIDNYIENPRHDIGVSQEDTLRKLFHQVGFQNMFNLAQDIYVNGFVNASLITVVPKENSDRYIVYEGNRRIACAKLIEYPERFPFLTKNQIDRIKKMKKEYSSKMKINEINCLVTTEEEAFFIMKRLHSGEDKGKGVKAWDTKEKDNFLFRTTPNIKKNTAQIIHEKFLEFFKSDIQDKMAYTNVQRLFNNIEVKKALGIKSNEINSFTEDRMKIINKIIDDINDLIKEKGTSVSREFNARKKIEDVILPMIEKYQKGFMNEEPSGEENENQLKSRDNDIDVKGSNDKDKPSTLFRNLYVGETIESDIIDREIVQYIHEGIEYDKLDKNKVGRWKIVYKNGDICYLEILSLSDPSVTQLIKEFVIGEKYSLVEIFKLTDGKGGQSVRPFNIKITPERNRIISKYDVTFNKPGSVNFQFSIEDKITKRERDFEFNGVVRETQNVAAPDYSSKIVYPFMKLSENIEVDIITFKNELNDIYKAEKYNLIFVSSIRTFVELIVNDIVDQLGESKRKELAENYKIINREQFVKREFIDKIEDERERAGIETIYKEMKDSGRYTSLLNFLNLSTHGAQRLINKERLVSEFDVINFLYTYLCFVSTD